MNFRNVQIYRLPENWDMSAERLAAQLSRTPFHLCGSQDLSSQGWVAPCDHANSMDLVHQIGGQYLIAMGIEQRLLPASVINQAVADRAEEIERQQGFKPGRKLMKEIKEEVVAELLPRSFTRRRKVYAWIDRAAGWLVIDAASRGAAEPVVEMLHKSMDELPLKLINTNMSPAGAMTDWLSGGDAPGGFTIDQDCTLQALTDEGSKVRYSRHSLEGEDVREHIASGKTVASLALSFDDRIGFILTERFEIKRVQLLDVVTEQPQGDAKTHEEQFDSDFALMTGELSKLIPALFEALGGEVGTV